MEHENFFVSYNPLHVNNTSKQELITYETPLTKVLINILKNTQDVILEKKLENGTIWLNAYEDNTLFVIEITVKNTPQGAKFIIKIRGEYSAN